jgi:hypothetical protein
MVYSVTSAESALPLELSRGNLLLMALLIGNDYDEVWTKHPRRQQSDNMSMQRGLEGCGISLARRVAQTGLGGELFMATLTCANEAELQPFLQQWRNRLQQAFLTLGHRHVATSLSENFPPWQAVVNYVHPVITPSSSLSAAWVPRLPCLSRITVLCERLFTWGSVLGIRSKLADLVWPGACARRLLTVRDGLTN